MGRRRLRHWRFVGGGPGAARGGAGPTAGPPPSPRRRRPPAPPPPGGRPRGAREAGGAEEALAWLRSRAEAGDPFALPEVAAMLGKLGRASEAAQIRRHGIEPGGRTADPWQAALAPPNTAEESSRW